jgi:hypothetical protein
MKKSQKSPYLVYDQFRNHIIIKLKMKKSLFLYVLLFSSLWTSLPICFIVKKLHSNKVDMKVQLEIKDDLSSAYN